MKFKNHEWIPNEVVADPPLDKYEKLFLAKFSILVTILIKHATITVSESVSENRNNKQLLT